MRIEQLEYFAAVIQHGSLRRASEALHVSQPALSEGVGKLERELGTTLLDRRRSGARISRRGQDLLPYMTEVLESVDRLRGAAGDVTLAARTVRIGTVNAANSSILVPALQDFRASHPGTNVEVQSTQQADIVQGLAEGSLDLGLVNMLPGDDVPPQLTARELAQGRPVVCLPAGHPLAERTEIGVEELRTEPFILMRAGYLMHRFMHRVFEGELPRTAFSTDGAQMGKLMVAKGLGLTVLPDFSAVGDPLVDTGQITSRPLAGEATSIRLLMLTRALRVVPPALQALQIALLHRAEALRHEVA